MTEVKPWGGRDAQRARRYVLQRDNGICWICHHPGADSLDHIKQRKTHPELTWDPTNWAAAHGAAQPQFGCPGQYARGNNPGPRRSSPDTRIHVVLGPPAAGKSTYVGEQRSELDIVIDHDALGTALGSPHAHTHTGPHTRAARQARRALIDWALNDRTAPTTWIIHTAPGAKQLHDYSRAMAQAHLLDPGITTCLARAKAEREPWTLAAIRDWYNDDAQRLHTWAATTPTATPAQTTREW